MPERNDKPVPRAAEKAIFHEAASACPFCGDTTLAALQVHHIDARANGGTNERSNLILTCASCHDKIEAGLITLSDVLKAKAAMRRATAPTRKRRPDAAALPSNVVSFRGPNFGVVANQVTMTTPRRPRLVPPKGVLATDADRRSYVLYLIKRYLKFKEADVKGAMKHAIIYKAIEREFGCTWEFVPLVRFDDLVTFLQHRIDDTKLGRNQRARGERRYSTYPEYLSGHRY
jgi:HNH endonuclease